MEAPDKVTDDEGHEFSHDDDTAEEDSRRQALAEADQVLDVIGGHTHLDGFNLLGVIANPLSAGGVASPTTTTQPASPSSFHGRYTGSGSDHGGGGGTGGSTTAEDYASHLLAAGSSYYQSLTEMMTLQQVTEQMEALNVMLEDWSRLISEDEAEDVVPPSQLTELPPDFQHIDTQSVKNYLQQTGEKAEDFQQHVLFMKAQERERAAANEAAASTAVSTDAKPTDVNVTDIPDIFFDKNFDLTDPRTFCQLLLSQGDGSNGTDLQVQVTDGPVEGWFPLLPPDGMNGHLDKVELALLEQVRSKSDRFFAESQRFAQLQEWIQSLLQQVVTLQGGVRSIRRDLLEPLETVPVADSQRAQLRKLGLVLERADDMLQCTHSLAGVLSAQDDLTAIEQIQYGRRLLAGTVEREEEDVIELSRLQSLKPVADQLNQYEQLVVSNLRDELVELFLTWNSDQSAYGAANSRQQVYDRVKEISSALRSCHALAATKEAYQSRLLDVMRMTVRTVVGEFASDDTGGSTSVGFSATAMSIGRFLDCLDMLFEQILTMLTSAHAIDEFCREQGLVFLDDKGKDENDGQEEPRIRTSSSDVSTGPSTPLQSVIIAAAELSSKSVSELLRLRKEAHSLLTLEEMKSIWDACLAFATKVEKLSGTGHTSALRSTLLAQAKAFVERKHESHMSALVAALDSERWTQCEVSTERQATVTRLCEGRSIMPSLRANGGVDVVTDVTQKSPYIEVEGTQYKVVWSCLLLVEMVLSNIASAAHFPSLATGNVAKTAELLRLFNSRTTQLVLGAGAIHSNAKLKSINAKHLSLVTQCLGMVTAILPHVRAAFMAQMPKKQHTLLTSLDQVKRDYADHNEKVLNKFVSIIGGIVEHGLAKKIPGTDFDARAMAEKSEDGTVSCCIFLEGVSTNTRKMHQVLSTHLPPAHLVDTFSRIFAFLDTKVPALFIAASAVPASPPVIKRANSSPSKSPPTAAQPSFKFPETDEGKKQMLLEVEQMTKNLNSLNGVHAWDFTATNVLERRLEYYLTGQPLTPRQTEPEKEPEATEKVASVENGTTQHLDTPAQATEDSPSEENGDGRSATDTCNVENKEEGPAADSPESDQKTKPDLSFNPVFPPAAGDEQKPDLSFNPVFPSAAERKPRPQTDQPFDPVFPPAAEDALPSSTNGSADGVGENGPADPRGPSKDTVASAPAENAPAPVENGS